MKRIIITFFLIKIFLFEAAAQSASPASETSRAPQGVMIQGGGDGYLTALYDRRLVKRSNGLGFATGIGFYGGGGSTTVTVPVSIYYLLGKRNHFGEVAAGATYATRGISIADIRVSDGSIFYSLSGGYRYQRTPKGFFLRAGGGPRFFSGGQTLLTYYLGLGYSF